MSKVYQSAEQKTTVISNLNLHIQAGEFTVVMGSSGSGKSTLLYLLSGLDQVSDGEIWLDSRPVPSNIRKSKWLYSGEKRIGFVFQDPNLVPSLSVRENILIAGYIGGESRKKNSTKNRRIIGSSGLG